MNGKIREVFAVETFLMIVDKFGKYRCQMGAHTFSCNTSEVEVKEEL